MSSSGKLAEDGAGLKQRFKRATVTGGKRRGARYTDLSEAEIRRCATAYKGDPRFAQYCKQWVSLHLLSPVEDSAGAQPQKQPPKLDVKSNTWTNWGWEKANRLTASLRSFARGRKLLAVMLLLSLGRLVARLSFGILSSKLTILVIRGFLRRTAGFLASVVDAVLDEAIDQVESALSGHPGTPLPPPHVHAPPGDPYGHAYAPVFQNTLHWVAHVILGIFTFYRRGHGPAAV